MVIWCGQFHFDLKTRAFGMVFFVVAKEMAQFGSQISLS